MKASVVSATANVNTGEVNHVQTLKGHPLAIPQSAYSGRMLSQRWRLFYFSRPLLAQKTEDAEDVMTIKKINTSTQRAQLWIKDTTPSLKLLQC